MDLEEAMWLAWQGIRPPLSPEVEAELEEMLEHEEGETGIDCDEGSAAPEGRGDEA